MLQQSFLQGRPIMPEKINESEIKQPDALRRQLVKGGLATPVVLATLASKQVLGAAPYNCTISGKMSGNASGHGQAQACGIGRSPGYWKYPNAPQFHTWPASSWAPGNPFYGSASGGAALLDAFHGKTLLQVLCTSGGNNGSPYAALARAVIATVLNSVKFAPNYAISGSEDGVIWLTGDYTIDGSIVTPSNFVLIGLNAKVTLAAGTNLPMLVNSEQNSTGNSGASPLVTSAPALHSSARLPSTAFQKSGLMPRFQVRGIEEASVVPLA